MRCETRKSYAFAAPTRVHGGTCAYHNFLAFCPPVRGANSMHAARIGNFKNPNLQKTAFYTSQMPSKSHKYEFRKMNHTYNTNCKLVYTIQASIDIITSYTS